MIDKKYCMSSYLMFRTIYDHSKEFTSGMKPRFYHAEERKPVNDSYELEAHLRKKVEKAFQDGRPALALSGGIDSAILAKFCPKGTVAYTFKCVVPGIQVVDETEAAARYAQECGLDHRVIEIYWKDFEQYTEALMRHKGAPIHSIEVQIYKACLRAKSEGFDTLIFGESADCNFGGLSQLMSREWTAPEFIERFSNVLPYRVLKSSDLISEPFEQYETENGYIDVHEFLRNVFFQESVGSYENASNLANTKIVVPYATSFMACPMDYIRVRKGENKYLIREIFERLYSNFKIPPKTPMPRPMNEWFADWEGPTRPEFWKNCVKDLKGDQKWLVWALEKFLNIVDEVENTSNI